MSERPAMSANNLPWEIIESILPLLPAKSLGRFKSVSKTWDSLISSPQFIKTHLHQNIQRHQPSKLILVSNAESIYSVDTSQLFQCLNSDYIPVTPKELSFGSTPIRWSEMLGSCNGLVLAKDENGAIFLMNPTTREVWKVPLSPFDADFFVRYGFGYDSSTDDYKVVSISFWHPLSESGRDTDLHLSVYSLRNNSWTKLPNSPYDHRSFHLFTAGFINQNLNFHWSASSSTIVAFSLANEEFSQIKLPDSIANNADGIHHLLHVGGKLGVFVGVGDCYELWVMEESWTRLCSFGVVLEAYPIRPVFLVEGSSQIIMLGDEYKGEVIVYNMGEGICRNVKIVGGPSRYKSHEIGGIYVETLESPKRVIISHN